MTELEYVPWGDEHFCQPPSVSSIKEGGRLRVGTTWTCPECQDLHTVVKINGTSWGWISFGPGAAVLQRPS